MDNNKYFNTPKLDEAITIEEKNKKTSLWDKTKKSLGKAVDEVAQPLKQGLQNVVDVFSPVETNISELESVNDVVDNALTPDENDVGFRTYRRIGELAKLKEGLGDATKEDVDTYNQNLKKLVTEDLGYDGLGFDSSTNTYYVVKDGKESDLDPTMFQNIVGEVLGDKAEMYGAIAGAKAGSKLGGGAKGKILGAVAGGALGAGAGSVLDTTASILSTGQELSAKQFAQEVGKSLALDATGAVVGGAVIKVAGKTLKVPAKAWDLLKNGNVDGAKDVLKTDLKLSDEDTAHALSQLAESQVEQYGEGTFKGLEKKQEELLASVMQHPQGERIVKEAVANNPKASFELEQSIDKRAKQVLDSTSEATDGTTIKKAVEGYESRVKKQYADMRNDFKEAFKETDYRFDLKDLKLDETLSDLEGRVADPFAKEKFKSMVGVIENTIEQSKNGVGVERDIDSLFDIRQQMNSFYRKNKNALSNKKDKDTFFNMVDNIDKEIDNALNKIESPELKKGLLDSFDSAKVAYKEMFDTKENPLYKTLMSEGKSAEERVTALLKHAKDDADEFQSLLSKLEPEEAVQVEDTIIKSILDKNKSGKASEMQSIDYASVVDEFEKLKPFIKSDHTKKSMELVEDMYKKYQHDFSLSKVVKGVTANTPSGGIATSAEGRMKAAGAKRLFDFIQTMIPFSKDAQRLALQRHIGTALEKSRTPTEMARRLAFDKTVPKESQQTLRELIKANNTLLRAKGETAKAEALKKVEEIASKAKEQSEAFKKSVEEFKAPDLEELKAVEKLVPDDRVASFAGVVRRIQEGKASSVDVEKYLKAKEGLEPKKLNKLIEKEQLLKLPAKYKEVGEEQIKELESLRDHMISSDKMGFSEQVNPQQFKALIYDLKTKGYPRSLKYDEIYQDLRGAYSELENDINQAYREPNSSVLDDFGNPLFGVGAVGAGVVASSPEVRADDSLDALVGLDDENDLWDENVVIEKFKDIDERIYKINRSYETTPKEKRVLTKALENQKEILTKHLVKEKPKDYKDSKKKNIKDVIAHIESRGDYNAANPHSSARGKYQFMSRTLTYVSKKMGLPKAYLKTPKGQERAMDFLMAENERVLRKKGVPIGAFTLYGGHQLGASGFARAYKGKATKKDISNMKNNLPKKLRSGDVVANWMNYYKGKVANA